MPHIWTLPPHGLMARLPLLALLVLILVASSVSAITFQLGSPLLGNMPPSDAFVRIQPLVYSNWPKLNTNSYPVDYSYTYISGAAYVSTTSYSAYFFAFDKFAYVGSDSQLPVDTITDANSQCLLFGGFQQQITATNEFQPNVFFVGAPTPASVLHMMWILLQSDRLPMQLSYYRIVSTGAGQGAMAAATTEPPKLGCSTVTYLASQTQTTADFNTLINSKPLALFMAGTQQPYDQYSNTQDFCNAVFNSAVLQQINTSMYTEFYMGPDVLTYYGSNTRAFPRSNIFVSSPTPSITQTAYPIVQGFTTEITSVQSNYLSSNSNFVASIALAGWVTTRVAMQSVMQYSGPMSDTIPSLRAGMNAMQSAYVLHDTFFGTFAGAVTAFAQEQGAIGSSSFVGNAMYLSQMTAPTANAPNGDFVGVPNSEYIFGLGKTLQLNSGYYLDTITLYATAYAVGVSLTDDPVTAYVCDQASVATGVVQRTSPNTVSNHGYRGRCVSSTTAGITAALAADVATYVTTNLLIGVLPDGFDTSSRFVVDPIPASPSLRVASSNMVYLFATLEQQMYVSAVYLYMHLRPKLASTKVCGIVRGPQATAILDLMNLTMTTFGMEMQQADMVSLSAGGNMVAAIPAGCDVVLLIGIAGNEVSSLQAFLASNPSTFAFVDFDALTMNYPNFVTSFGTTNAATKLLFATNLPSWTTATATTSPTAARQFLNAAGANYNTPAALRQMYVSLLIDQLTNNGNTQALPTDLQTIFSKIDTAITLGGLNFGPFNPNDCLSVAGVEEPNDCLGNTGARDLLVWSLAYMQTPGRGPLTAPTTPSMMYNAFYVHSTSSSNDVVTEVANTAKCRDFNPESVAGSSSSGSNHLVNPFGGSSKEVNTRNKKVLDGVLFALLGLLLLIVLILILVVLWLWGYLRWCCAPTVSSTKESAKDAKLYEAVRSPPTKEELSRCHTVTVATVDVAASVALWTTVPRAMSAATLASRRAVRAAAVRHGCYEVRHLGDVFVVACRDPPCALAFATEVQRNARGGVNGRVRDEVAASYERLVNAREDARTVKPPAPAPGACLLLRVGVHAGVRTHGEGLDAACERLGDVALRAGGVAGCAAGTIVTRDALPPSDDRVVLTSLGAYALGNSTEPMELFKLQQQRSTSDTAATEAYFTVPHGVQMLRSGTEHSDAPLAEYVRQTMGAVTCASSTPTHRSLLHHVHHSFGMDTQVVPAESAREAAVVERTTAILERRRRVGLGIAVPRHPHLMKRCGAGSTGDVLTAANGIEIEAAGTTSLSLHAWEVVSRGTVGAHRGPYQDADWIGGVELSRSGEALTATEVVEGGALNNDPWRGEVVGVHAPSSVERCFSRSESLPLHAEEVVHGRHPRGVTDEEPRYSEWQQSSCTKGTSVQPLLSDNSPVLYRRGSLPDKEVHAVPRGQAPSLGRRGLRYISREMVDSVELLGASFVDKDVDDLDHENVQTRTLMKGEHQPWSQVDPVQQQLARGAGASPVTVSAAKEAPPGVEELSVEDLGCEVPPRGQLSEECADINSSEPSSINPSFLRGQTTFVADRVKPCFSQGNGLLFRMTNSTTGQWAYYNATTDYMMHVHFVAGAKSRIVALGSTKLLPPDEQRQHYQGDLWVGPKCTELLMAGTLRGYDVQYKAIPLSRIM